jgi:hypothetical protein
VAETMGVADITHLIVTREHGFGYSAESPQIPGLCFGRPTEAEFRRDYQGVLQDLGVRGKVIAHLQTRGVVADGQEFVIRCADDEHKQDRLEVARRIEALLSMDRASDLLSTETTPMGEVVFAAAVPSDDLGLFMDQLYDENDALVISAAVADHGLFTMTLASGKRSGEGWGTLDEHGWDRATTISQLLRDAARGRQPQRILV